ncbi:hypothetical protein INS49_010318 [Diaporthe citri]|uniref:uncharacterized protein n=1 Tax=Diaporthe citri TaxID=83186 RepID=UPI001C810AD8|nr:uncharacterized protein INS49_010318 [Diaporthe citri]KAG6362089.1 hypothetical protein INS49_010318 [Diaporthe citri]
MDEVHFDSVTSLERRDAQMLGGLFKQGARVPKAFEYGDDDEEDEDENELLKQRKRKSDIIRKIRKRSQSMAEEEGLPAQGTSGESSVTEDPMKKEPLPAAKKSKQSFKEGQRTPKRKASAENDIVST